MEKIYRILSDIRPEFNYRESENFIADGLLDSFDMIALVSEIESEFGILIDAMDMTPENFKNAAAISDLISRS